MTGFHCDMNAVAAGAGAACVTRLAGVSSSTTLGDEVTILNFSSLAGCEEHCSSDIGSVTFVLSSADCKGR